MGFDAPDTTILEAARPTHGPPNVIALIKIQLHSPVIAVGA
jgi:hypothetical protein